MERIQKIDENRQTRHATKKEAKNLTQVMLQIKKSQFELQNVKSKTLK